MSVEVKSLASGSLACVLEITPDRFGDDRGYFMETYNRNALRGHGIELDFMQDNQSLSRDVGTVRGLHFQTPPFAQPKIAQSALFSQAEPVMAGSPRQSHSPVFMSHFPPFLQLPGSS